jgi:hypothetical protein
MKYTVDELRKRYEKAAGIKNTWDSIYGELFAYTMPARDGYNKPQDAGDKDGGYTGNAAELYTSIGEQSANDFVNTMQESLCPPQAKWIELEAGYRFPADARDAAGQELAKVADIANEYKNISNFDEAFSEFCYDVFAGTGCLLVLPGTEFNPLVFKAIPLKEFCIEEGDDGDVCAVYRKYSMPRERIKYQWPEVKESGGSGDADKQQDAELLECTYLDRDKHRWIYSVIDNKDKRALLEKEYSTNPFRVLRWNKAPGEVYGRGVGLTALNDIMTLNLIKKYGIMALAYILPPLFAKQDGLFNQDTADLTPFALNWISDDVSVNDFIQPLNLGGHNINLEQYKTLELQQDIRRNTYGNALPNEGSKQLTATEINSRLMELRRNLNSVFGRLIRFQVGLVQRILDVLISVGVIQKYDAEAETGFDITKVDKLIYRIKINSPISRQIKAQEAQSIILAVQMLSQLDPSGQTLTSVMKVNEAAGHVLELMGVPKTFTYTPEEAAAIQQRMSAAQAQAQQNAAAADVQSSNAKELGKAQARLLLEGDNYAG